MTSALSDVWHVAVGSMNPVKIGAARSVLAHLRPDARVDGIAVASGVPHQPWGDEETIRGAIARAQAAREVLDADWGIGIEGGVVAGNGEVIRTCAWAAIVMRDGREGIGGSLSLELPANVAALVRDGMELGHAMDAVTGTKDVKRGLGAVGILTGGLVTRQGAYETLVAYAAASLLGKPSRRE